MTESLLAYLVILHPFKFIQNLTTNKQVSYYYIDLKKANGIHQGITYR